MFFVLSKALLFLLSPFFWFALSVGLYLFWKNERWKKRLKWISVGIFVFFTNTVIFSEFCRLWEVPGVKIQNLEVYDVGIILGGMSEYNSDLDELSIRRQGDRIFQAITLYKQGKIKKLLISGDSGYLTDRGLHEAKQMKTILIKWGIPAEDILTEEKSVNTHENAEFTADLLAEHKDIRKCLLITSGIHMRRARACFAKEGLKCDTFSTDLYANQKRNYFWDQYIIPNIDNFNLWRKLMKEMIGYITYDIAGYI
jgi:uncharacterized SAM-binding protein YcdF (DUF218 family)